MGGRCALWRRLAAGTRSPRRAYATTSAAWPTPGAARIRASLTPSKGWPCESRQWDTITPIPGRDLNALGALYHQAGRLDEARAAYGRALVIFEAAYGLDHFEVAMACANLAVLAGDEGNHMEAETLGLRSLGILETVLGPDDAEVGLTLHNLGVAVAVAVAVAALGRAREAASLFERANRTLAAALPEGHPHLASTRESQQELSLD